MTPAIEAIWSVCWLAGIGALLAAMPRLGRLEVASWLAVIGIGVLTIEEPLLTFWFALTDSHVEIDGLADLVTPQARAHVFGASAARAAWAGSPSPLACWPGRSRSSWLVETCSGPPSWRGPDHCGTA